jgi:general secretion pathway protein K
MKLLRFALNRRPMSRDGFIIVAVLWILGALATLATIYSIYVINTAVALTVHDDRLQAEALVSGAVEIAVYKMKAQPNVQPTHGRFSFRANRANVAVEFKSEAARIDLNAAPKALLAGLFTALGARADAAETYADRIIAWRSGPKPGTLDDETSAYRTAGLSYGPRLAPFPHTGELWLVLGLPPAMVERALPFVTVYSGQPQINLLDAAPEVVASLPGMTPARLQDVLAQRQSKSQNAQDFIAALGAARGLATAGGSKAMRVIVRVDFENGRRMRSEAVVLPHESGNEPYSVLSWRDDLDEVLEDSTTGLDLR